MHFLRSFIRLFFSRLHASTSSRTERPGKDQLGKAGERAAEKFLKNKGFEIVGRNVRLASGELDLIAAEKGVPNQIVIVEVKTRRDRRKGSPALAVHRSKQSKITTLAVQYLQRERLLGKAGIRFDIVAIHWPDDESAPIIEHYENAFDAVGSNLRY